MIFTIVFLSMISMGLSVGLYYSVKKNLELIDTVERTMEQVEKSVDILDYYYKRIDKKTKTELFSDDPTIRDLVDDMKQSRRAVLLVSEALTGERELNEEPPQEV